MGCARLPKEKQAFPVYLEMGWPWPHEKPGAQKEWRRAPGALTISKHGPISSSDLENPAKSHGFIFQ